MTMMSNDNQAFMVDMQNDIRDGLKDINVNSNWLELYQEWESSDKNQFTHLLAITDSFNPSCAGDSYVYDTSDESHMRDLDVMKMSVFLSEHLRSITSEVFLQVKRERNKEKKLYLIERYFSMVDGIVSSKKLAGCIVTLNEAAEKQMVLQGDRAVDLYVAFYSLRENLRKRSTESLYLLFTYWRITHNKKDLKVLVSSLIDYVQTYFDDFDRDPDMHLYYPLDGLMIVKKLAVISHWLELIAFHTNGIFEKYKELEWLCPVDRMTDDIIGTNQISKFEMLQYKRIFMDDDNETVRKKAVCNHGYAIWIKTVDVMHIVCDIFQVLYHSTDEDLKKMNTSKPAMLEQFDNMTKIRNYYTGKVFFHQVYYQLEREYLDSQVMEALEADAELFKESVNDILQFVEAISSDDIESLMQAKQKYIVRLKEFTTEEQEEKLDELSVRIVEKIKSEISKKDVYDELYAAVSEEFEPYLSTLAKFPNIFSSLVSAEYLFKQYVEGKEARERFDYSCISIMYYMSLEDFLNKLVYIPYARDVLSTVDKKDAKAFNFKTNTEWKKYVSDYTKFWRNGNAKDSCEIGVLGFLFEGIEGEECFKKYLKDKYNVTNSSAVKNYGQKLKDKSSRRNDAAHGGNYLKYEDVCEDKSNVYNVVNEYRGMILELLEMIFPQ